MSTYSHLLAARATLQVGDFKPREPSYPKIYPDRYRHVKATKRSGWRVILASLGLTARH